VALAKSIGGGLPLGAFGGKREYMDQITMGRVIHLGTYNGNPLCMAAAKAVLSEVCTPQATAATIGRNKMLVDACNDIIDAAGLPAHTIQFGAKGCVTWAPVSMRRLARLRAGSRKAVAAETRRPSLIVICHRPVPSISAPLKSGVGP